MKYKKCSKCGAKITKKDGYCRSCRSKYNKQYKRHIAGNYIYIFVGRDLEPLYVGSCKYIGIRTSDHLNGHSHLKRTLADWKLLGLNNIEYAIVDVETKKERLYIEKYLIDKWEPLLNNYAPIVKITDKKRKEDLRLQADNLVFRILDNKLLKQYKKNA